MPLAFGTDGVRGRANDELTPEVAVAFGRAVVATLGVTTLLVGRDTRRSSPMLAAGVCAGAASEGAVVRDLGVIPTPGVAAHCVRASAPGVVVSASHNPFGDNGLKVIGPDGRKLAVTDEAAVEASLTAHLVGSGGARPFAEGVGWIEQDPDAPDRYAAWLVEAAGAPSLDGLHVVVDCAHGAASAIAPHLFEACGARVTAIGASPDGCNINDEVGSTAPKALARAVTAAGADLGVAVDGDADRCVAVDASGAILDGDWLLALFATDRQRHGTLGGGVVVTVMANLGLRRTLRTSGIEVHEVPVGDRHVADALVRTGWTLGGEQSGHIVFSDAATTGDGILTGLLLARLVAERGPLASLTEGLLVLVPQILVNVEVADASALADAESVWAEVEKAHATLGDRGRVVLRASGTEPVVRVMVEAEDEDEMRCVAEQLRACVLEALGPAGGPG